MKVVSVVFLLLALMLAFCSTTADPPKDCSEVTFTPRQASVGLTNGVLTGEADIYPIDSQSPVKVSCVQLPGEVKKYTVILKRTNGLENFNRMLTEYRNNFGVAPAEYFIGLENLHRLTSSKNYELLIRLKDSNDVMLTAHYSTFSIGTGLDNYPLTVSGFTRGDAGDILTVDNGQMFINCAQTTKTGFWYGSCESASPHEFYIKDAQDTALKVGMKRDPNSDQNLHLKFAIMMIRPLTL